jgi:hypothetical protein
LGVNDENKHAASDVSATDTNVVSPKVSKLDLKDRDRLNLHLQEYGALRAEQRTRLDSANKIIHYSAVVLAAVIVGLLSLYKSTDPPIFKATFRIVLLLVPVVVLPFAFTQQNEEILVRHIGNYLRKLKEEISFEDDQSYWGWETFHAKEQPWELLVTGFFRAGLLIIFSVLALLSYYSFFGWPISPLRWLQIVEPFSLPFALGALQALDLFLTISAILVGILMFFRMNHAKHRESKSHSKHENHPSCTSDDEK